MKFNTIGLMILTSLFLTACGSKTETLPAPIGKFDHAKGVIEEEAKFLPGISPEWHHLDLNFDAIFGVSDEMAYDDFKLTQKNEVIVAVIDSGVDIYHEDLKDVLWVNKKEIAGNGIDDDGNGYIDDVHGWNFLGSKDGKNIEGETLEVTRIFARLTKKVKAGEILTQTEEELLQETSSIVSKELKSYTKRVKIINKDLMILDKHLLVLNKKLGITKITKKVQLTNINTDDKELKESVSTLLTLWKKYWKGIPGMASILKRANHAINVYYNINFNARAEIIGDDPSDFNDTDYGNNNVKGPDSRHGTHVAGIIAASRNNNIGYNGIAGNVKIMSLRAVPNGDERDKDIALAVRYAVDNGAKIINMSFGKAFSTYKAEVDAAFQYAVKKGVLLVHAAGNDGKNTDFGSNNYPSNYLINGGGVLTKNRISNWIEVGASDQKLGLDLIANFSNYGKDAVTLFAPGKSIMATLPENLYGALSGTSMASPVTAGVLALLLCEFKTMTGTEALGILLKTLALPKDGLHEVRKPSDIPIKNPDYRLPVPFASLSQTGGLVNAYKAVQLARDLAKL